MKRLVSGIQPTGQMHLGNYLGAVKNWVTHQEQYDSFFFLADLHSLTTVYEQPAQLREDKWNLALDLLSVGIDPNKAHLFFQSDVPQHNQLHLILSMITPLPWLTRVPTYKGKKEEIQDKDLDTYGFLGYPVLQTADILLYKGDVVPVGKDQLPHLELAREITRRFNHLYTPIFPEPDAQLTSTPFLAGTDGRKMSKSYNNTIPINSSEEAVTKQVMRMVTDPNRVQRTDPGNPDICSVFAYHTLFNTADRTQEIKQDCQAGRIGCVDCKRECALKLNAELAPFRDRRHTLSKDKDTVHDILSTGAAKARAIAEHTMAQVHEVIGL